MKEKYAVLDEIRITHRNKDGKILSDKVINRGLYQRLLVKLGLRHNSITNDGFAQMAAWILADIDADHSTYYNCDFIGIGIGTDPALATDYQLDEQVGDRQAGTGTRVTSAGGPDNDTAQLVATFSQAIDPTLEGTDAICEVGMFWEDEGIHVMLLRQKYTPADNCNWDAGDTLQVTIKVQVKQGT